MASLRIPKKPDDFISDKEGWGKGIGQRFRAFRNIVASNNGAIAPCAGRQCEFFRRDECWRDSIGIPCVWPYYWLRVDDDGNVLDRDGFVWLTKEQAEKVK